MDAADLAKCHFACEDEEQAKRHFATQLIPTLGANTASVVMSSMPPEMMAVHEALRRYVAVHDEIFRFSWRRLLPLPGVFEAIPYDQLETELASVVDVLMQNERLLRERADVPRLFCDYVLALRECVEALRSICAKLYEESQGAVGAYRYRRYRKDVVKYDDLTKRYQTLGARINEHR